MPKNRVSVPCSSPMGTTVETHKYRRAAFLAEENSIIQLDESAHYSVASTLIANCIMLFFSAKKVGPPVFASFYGTNTRQNLPISISHPWIPRFRLTLSLANQATEVYIFHQNRRAKFFFLSGEDKTVFTPFLATVSFAFLTFALHAPTITGMTV
ncbi:hypothetical protein DM02DRAFT_614807 [Periconia macrospinosa]|uniref:Uncharacterized protein n=1 Tax=Periconia macrospinosa TaxID=97972 RepID=A0A2V1DP51_9PLEO|nr:hypothetical protein DM02DRAFT_614807 [Periconia macrospinosa]